MEDWHTDATEKNMKLNRLKITNFLRIKQIDVQLRTPVIGLFGDNEAGKSSVADGVRLAMLGDLGRINLKKDAAQLIRDGAKGASVELHSDAGLFAATIGTSIKTTGAWAQGAAIDAAFVEAVLSPHRFAAMADDERRAFLFKLTGRPVTREEIAERLKAHDCDDAKTRVILLLTFREGFPAAEREAQRYATESRGAFKQVTGDIWGSRQSADWRAPVPPVVPGERVDLDQVQAAELKVAELNQAIGAAREKIDTHRANLALMNVLRQQARQHARASEARNAAEQQLKEHQAKVERARGIAAAYEEASRLYRAGVRPVVTTYPCPECGVVLELIDAKLVPHVEDHNEELDIAPEPPPEYIDLPALERGLKVLESAAKDRQRQVDDTDAAARRLAEMEAAEQPDPMDLPDLQSRLAEAMDYAKAARAQLNAQDNRQQALDQAEQTTAKAARAHQDVLQWVRLAACLGPSGVPGELLSETLAPFNARLRHTSGLAGWRQPLVADDMRILIDGRSYGLLSRSARFRADVLLAEAITHLSGFRFLLLDEIDICDIPNRVRLIALLDALAGAGEIDTAIMLGTLKALPKGLPETMEAHWLEDGALKLDEQKMAEVAT